MKNKKEKPSWTDKTVAVVAVLGLALEILKTFGVF